MDSRVAGTSGPRFESTPQRIHELELTLYGDSSQRYRHTCLELGRGHVLR